MSYHPRIESKERGSFVTTRSRASRLWFVNNKELEQAILGYAAKYSEKYGVKLYALAIEGNHIQAPALFPNQNRSSFMRDFNSTVAKAVIRHTPEYEGGKFWARRYSQEFLPAPSDIEEYFFYTVLQPVQDGLVEKLSEYPGYNCFHDAVLGKERKFKVVQWGEYNKRKAYNSSITIDDFTQVVSLRYSRLPDYEHLSAKEYAKYMNGELERRRTEIVQKRRAAGLGFLGPAKLKATPRGAAPRNTKTSDITSHRPRVLSKCPIRREECKTWYFTTYFNYKLASKLYRSGEHPVTFPDGTYKPYIGIPLALTDIAA